MNRRASDALAQCPFTPSVPASRGHGGVWGARVFPTMLLISALQCGTAHAHHIPVSAEVPAWNGVLWAGLGGLLALEVAFLLAARRRMPAERLERLWMLAPLPVLFVLAAVRVTPMFRASVVRDAVGSDALRLDVTARQWQWDVRYPVEGLRASSEIHIPAGRDVQLRLDSLDVLHAFEVPRLGVRSDVRPGAPAVLNLRVPRPGRYTVYCSALCGTEAQEMTGVLAVDAPDEYDAWVARKRTPPPTKP